MNNIKNLKAEFLKKLKSNSKNQKYKRYNNLILRYPGGKSLAVGYIIENLPDNIEKIVSPFIGGGSIEIALAKELGIKVIGYDIFYPLVAFWQTVLNKNEKSEMLEILKNLKPTKEEFNNIKTVLKEYWVLYKDICVYKTKTKDEIKNLKNNTVKELFNNKTLLGAYFYFNWNTSYGPGFLGWPSSVYLNDKRYNKMLEKIESFEVSGLEVHLGTFEEVLPKHKKDFLYLDPPYYLEKDKDNKMFKGIYPSRNEPIFHNNFDHKKLKELLYKHKNGFILSYNNCETIRNWYKDFELKFPKWQYTMGQGEKRIGKYRKQRNENTNIKESHEILIIKR